MKAASYKFQLPSPLALAILLTAITACLCWWHAGDSKLDYLPQLAQYWEKGFWVLLDFGMQMMLILVLGHVLALSKPIAKLITLLGKNCHSTADAAARIALFSCLLSLFNWGLGLVFGAIFARSLGEKLKNTANYPLLGAAAYAGMMVWHGGLSGSAPLKVAEVGHFLEDKIGRIDLGQTTFSSMNLLTCALLLCLVPLFFYVWGKKSKPTTFTLIQPVVLENPAENTGNYLDRQTWLGRLIGLIFMAVAFQKLFFSNEGWLYQLTPNFMNWLLLGLCFLLHGSLNRLMQALNQAISDGAGILIQFPLYAGIMGMVKYSGMLATIALAFVEWSGPESLSLFTFFSAAIINVFVPSGGGQWIVQGPIIMDAASQLQLPLGKLVMALAYGDQLTNMIQPFWAIPLLAITGLKAHELLPKTFALMLLGTLIFSFVLLVF